MALGGRLATEPLPKSQEKLPAPSKVQASQNFVFQDLDVEGIKFEPNAVLTITGWNTASNVNIESQLWYIDRITGNLNFLDKTTNPQLPNLLSAGLGTSATPLSKTVNMPQNGGTIVSFAARAFITSGQSGQTSRGQTLFKAELDNKGSGNSSNSTTQVIVYGYVYTRKDLTYPSVDAIQDPVSGYGYQTQLAIETTGAAPVFTPGTNLVYKIRFAQIVYACSAQVANRKVQLSIYEDTVDFYDSILSPAMTASNVYTLNFVQNYSTSLDSSFDAGDEIRGLLPSQIELWVNTNDTLQPTITNVQTNDAVIINVAFEQFINPSS